MSAAHLDALVVSSLPNLFYLTGFRGSAGLLVVSAEGETLLVDARYSTGVQVLRDEGRLPSSLEVVLVDRTYEEALVDVVRQRGGGRIGLEGAHTSLNRYRWLVAALGVAGTADVELVPTDRLVESLRAVKDECEVALLRRAAGLLAGRAPAILELVREGRSEREIAANLDRQLVEAGFERPALKPSSPPARTAPCRMHARRPGGSRQATSSCWTSGASTTDTAWISLAP
jgi:Xaa-Pro aminopeptidase